MFDLARLGISVKLLFAKEAKDGLRDVAREAGLAERQTKKMEQSTKTLDGVMRGAAKAGAILGAALGTAFSAGTLVSAIDKYTEMSNLLKVVADDQSGVNDQLDRLAEIANSTRTPLESVVTLFQRVSTTANELGVSGEQVEKFVTNISTALALQGGSAEQASGALLQLSQALAGGVVRAEEFNSIIEGAFPIMQAAARGIDGVDGSIGKLRQMMLDGKLSAKVFFDAILSQSDELAASFGKTQATVGQALQVLQDRFTMFAGEFDRMTGLSGMLSDGILSLSQNIEGAVVWAGSFATALGIAGTAMWGLNGGAIAFLATMISLRAVLITLGVGVLTLAIGTLVNYLLDATRETGSFSAALEKLVGIANEVAQRVGQGFSLMGEMIMGVGMGISAAFATVWADILAGLDSMLNGAAARINTFLQSTGQFFSAMTGGAIEGNWGTLETNRTGGVEAQNAAADQAALAREYMDSINASFKDLFTKPLSGGMTGSRLGAPFDSLSGVPADLVRDTPAKTLDDKPPGKPKGGSSTSSYKKEVQRIKDETAALASELKVYEGFSGSVRDYEIALSSAKKEADLLAAAQESGLKITPRLKEEVHGLAQNYAEAAQNVKEAADAQQEMINQAGRIEDAFGGMFSSLVTGASSFKDALGQVLSQLAEMAADSAFQNFWGMATGEKTGSGFIGAAGSILSSMFGGFRANGGPVDAGKAYVVGEKRPEMFIPETSGTILPFVPRAQQSSGGVVEVRTYLDPQTGALDQKIERISGQSVRAAAPEIVGQSVSAVGAQNRRTRRYLGK
ncbi:hypothetical protein CN97_00720 [Haematobacter massiliensis]|uniref:Tape measure protein N-terminal domain-containing protein n=1 Tax=Haematobacter massiliensis TaxID=195105 RepID=A0A086Y0I5_9RHOB|nr:tape measure protein [Haematobacter massiliensis]KFI27785.1 hypothetical protein CN97_00720 [Haematobacter massiliensis]OWJ82708.1 tape measure domain-containing protein [Haematobacter massiliensis]